MTTAAQRSEAGLGLTEVLVSIVVLSLAMTTALVLYDDARRSFQLNENVIDQQQVVRIAFDMLNADLRMAGFNSNPDGADNRPDEQIEAAYATALVVRADLDAETPDSRVPEEALENAGIFGAVSTGNDEIVGYALGNPAAGGTLTYSADVAGDTRDGTVELVTVPKIALNPTTPPYTLYRITLADDASVVKTPLADNIRSLRFTYYDQAGNVVPPVGGSEDPVDVRTRQTIRRIVVEIEGLTRDADRNWVDSADTNPYSRQRRKFSLAGDVTPRNLGRKGLIDLSADLRLPPPNTVPVLAPGHCKGLYVKWSVPPRNRWAYLVSYQDADGAEGSVAAGGDGVYLSGLTHNRLHNVTLSHVDPLGNEGDPTPATTATTSNITAPAAPVNLTATDDLEGRIDVVWDRVTEGDGPIPGDPASPLLRDLRRYQLQYRRVGAPTWQSRFRPAGWTPPVQETDVVPCVDYQFRVRGQDTCDAWGPWSALEGGMAQSSVPPLAPSNIEAFLVGAGPSARIRWQEVVHNVDLDPVGVNYEIYRVYWPPGDPPQDLNVYERIASVPGDTEPLEYVDAASAPPPSQTVYYRIVATDGCGNASQPSDAVESLDCEFTGQLVFVNPVWGDPVTGPITVRVDVNNGLESYTELELSFTNLDTLITDPVITCPNPGPCVVSTGPLWKSWQADWNNLAARPHRIEAKVTTADECSVTRSILVELDE